MTGQEGFRFTEDPLADPVFGTPGGEPADGPAAVCHEVVKTYRTATESVTALDGVTLSIPRARVTVVVGPSGSGKSSLLRLLACIDRPDSGEVRVAGQRVDSLGARARRRLRQRQVAYLFQRPGENLLPYLDAAAQVRLAADLRGAKGADDDVHDPLDPPRLRARGRPPAAPPARGGEKRPAGGGGGG